MKTNGSVTMTLDSYNELMDEIRELKSMMKLVPRNYSSNTIEIVFDNALIYKRFLTEFNESEFATTHVPVTLNDFSIWGGTFAKQVVQDEE